MALNSPLPIREALLDPTSPTGLLNPRWQVWFRDLGVQVDAQPVVVIPPVEVEAQNASIGTTPLPTDALAPGLYRVSYFARITTAAVTSSSLTVTFTFTNGGISCSLSGTAITGNTTSSVGSGIFLIQIDQATPVSWSTTYASNGAGQMLYQLSVVLEAVSV